MNPGPVLRVELGEGTVILANEAARKVFGDQLVGRRWHDICSPFNTGRDRTMPVVGRTFS